MVRMPMVQAYTETGVEEPYPFISAAEIKGASPPPMIAPMACPNASPE